MLMNISDPTATPATVLGMSSTPGNPYASAAVAGRITPPTAMKSAPITIWLTGNAHRGKPAASKRRRTPVSRYDAM